MSAHLESVLATMATPFAAISNIKNIPAVREHMFAASGYSVNVVSPASFGIEKLFRKVSNGKVFLERFLDRFLRSPMGTVMFVVNKVLSLGEEDFVSNSEEDKDMMRDRQSGEERRDDNPNTRESSLGSNAVSENERINETLIILILGAIFLMLVDWRRQRNRVPRNA